MAVAFSPPGRAAGAPDTRIVTTERFVKKLDDAPVDACDSPSWSEIATLDADGTNQVVLTHAQAQSTHPSWSPHGALIAYEQQTCDPATADSLSDFSIHLMNADGSNDHVLDIPASGRGPQMPSWTPDGKSLLISERPQDETANTTTETQQLVLWPLDGSGYATVTHANDRSFFDPVQTGNKIAVWWQLTPPTDPDAPTPPAHFGYMDADGRNLVDLGEGASPRLSPDGRLIAFTDRTDLKVDVMSIDGSNRLEVLTPTDVGDQPNFNETVEGWSRDSRRVLVTSNHDGYSSVNVDGTGRFNIPNTRGLGGGDARNVANADGSAPGAVAARTPTTRSGARTTASDAARTAHASGRSPIAVALRAPENISTDLALIAVNVAIAGGIALLVFPAVLFNSTFEDNYDEIRRWARRKPKDSERRRRAAARWFGFAVVAATTAGLAALLDPRIKADRATALLVAGVGAATVITTVLGQFVKSLYLKETKGRIRPYPGGLVVGAVTVGVSRAVHFLPGYLYGIVGGFESEPKPDTRREGQAAALGELFAIVFAVGAWFAWQPIMHRAARPHSSVAVAAADAVLSAIAALSFQGLLFSMIPIKSLPGEKLWKWNKAVWAMFMVVGAFSFVHVLAHPAKKYTGSLTVMLALFAAFGAGSLAFWAFFRFKHDKPPASAAPVVHDRPRRERPLRAPGR